LKDVGYSTTFVGSVVTMRTAGLTLIRFLLGMMVARFGVVPLLFAAISICAVLMGLLPFVPGMGYAAISHFIAGMAFGMEPVLVSTLIAENTSAEERSLGMAIDSTVVNAGRMISGLALGGLAQAFGLKAALAGGNVFVLCGLAGVMLWYFRMAQRNDALAGEGSSGRTAS
jgi:MFS family permease